VQFYQSVACVDLPLVYPRLLALSAGLAASLAMRVFRVWALAAAATCFGEPFGIWKMNPARSTFSEGLKIKSFTVRIEPHGRGEVFTVDRTDRDGRTRSSSSILYFDGAARDFEGFECSGTQISRRLDGETVEILRNCGAGAWTKFVRRASPRPNELVLEIADQNMDRRHFDGRLILEKQ
jgi:hypothetical protein